MSALSDLISQIENPDLRARIQAETDKLFKQKKFGLVFEDHLPETALLYGTAVRSGMTAAPKNDTKRLLSVLSINDGECIVADNATKQTFTIPARDLVPVAQFGEPIYPSLTPIDSIYNNTDPDAPAHALIQADNYHALQLLEYLYAEKVDCIYIDPPYNTGARDWKYNNDYVDSSDTYRHSKWLSMMKKRLLLAKKLLNPADSVMIITIDEKEYLHLGCLLEELFPEARIQMVTTVINPAVVARAGEFGRSGEYIYYIFFGAAVPLRLKVSREWVSSKGRTHTGNVRWDLLKRSGTNSQREDRPNLFYPIFISNLDNKIIDIGTPVPKDKKAKDIVCSDNSVSVLLPIRDNGTEGCWQWMSASLKEGLSQGRVRVGGNAKKGYTVYILKDGEYNKIQNGFFHEIGRGVNNEIITDANESDNVTAIPGNIWKIASHDATQYGSRMLGNFFPDKRFSFPKSLYAVHDAIRFFVADKPNALIVDFFAGSGTTAHAVNLLNAEDGGKRQCIMVTNNEVSAEEAKTLQQKGFQPGDPEWERLGIAQYVTWPRTVCSIKGEDINGNPLKGEYIGSELKMSDGFKANAAFFRLGFLNKTAVSLGRQFKELLPLLWLKSGGKGKCPILETTEIPTMLILPENAFAVLCDENFFAEFEQKLINLPQITTVFIITDYENGFKRMRQSLSAPNCYQLYRDYLDNFRINVIKR